eukprot:1660231-Pleurochrysis_carterae.AAC.2
MHVYLKQQRGVGAHGVHSGLGHGPLPRLPVGVFKVLLAHGVTKREKVNREALSEFSRERVPLLLAVTHVGLPPGEEGGRRERRDKEASLGGVHHAGRLEPLLAREEYRGYHRLAKEEVPHPLGDDDVDLNQER